MSKKILYSRLHWIAKKLGRDHIKTYDYFEALFDNILSEMEVTQYGR